MFVGCGDTKLCPGWAAWRLRGKPNQAKPKRLVLFVARHHPLHSGAHHKDVVERQAAVLLFCGAGNHGGFVDHHRLRVGLARCQGVRSDRLAHVVANHPPLQRLAAVLAAGGGEGVGVGVMQKAPVGLQVVRGLMGAGVAGWWWHRGSFRLSSLAAQGEAITISAPP